MLLIRTISCKQKPELLWAIESDISRRPRLVAAFCTAADARGDSIKRISSSESCAPRKMLSSGQRTVAQTQNLNLGGTRVGTTAPRGDGEGGRSPGTALSVDGCGQLAVAEASSLKHRQRGLPIDTAPETRRQREPRREDSRRNKTFTAKERT